MADGWPFRVWLAVLKTTHEQTIEFNGLSAAGKESSGSGCL